MRLLFKLVATMKRALDIYDIDSQLYLGNSVGLLLKIEPKLLSPRTTTDLESLKSSQGTLYHTKGNVSKALTALRSKPARLQCFLHYL